jgi:hypothetical protein
LTTVLLIHGGLWEDMDARRFWHQPGIVAGLTRHGVSAGRSDGYHGDRAGPGSGHRTGRRDQAVPNRLSMT